MKVLPLELLRCRIATVQTAQATFTGTARFDGATFTRDMSFEGATMTSRHAGGPIITDRDGFGGATFTGDTSFEGATFVGHVSFRDAIFAGDTSFDGATFVGSTWFDGATFTGHAWFNSATFTGHAWFNSATFAGDTRFSGATFTGLARFSGATFTGLARFSGATFTSVAQFDSAIAECYDFSGAQFHDTDPGPWVTRRVNLTGAVFHVQARIALAAAAIDCRRLQAREGVHLVVRGSHVDLEDTAFLQRSILAHSGSEPSVPTRQSPGERPEDFHKLAPGAKFRWQADEKAFQLAQELGAELGPQQAKPTQVLSLRRATTGDLVLSGVGLERCTFAGAHGLDKLRISATCSFQRPPVWPRDTWRPFTDRRVIFEEVQWRRVHTHGWGAGATPSPGDEGLSGEPRSRLTARELTASFAVAVSTPKLDLTVPTALEIAGIYRDLRKGLEDAKDEPGARDFYYGEMEMRRLAARGSRHQRNENGGRAQGPRPSWTERRLLDAYWAVAGYGLRTWRALTALTILLLACAALFTLPTFTHLPDSPQHVASVKLHPGAAVPFATSLEFTARESLTLTRGSGPPLLQTTGAGTTLDIALRLLAPLLLGLTVLSLRGRIER